MKKVINLMLIVAIMASCAPKEPKYVINGNIEGSDSVTFILQKREKGKIVKIDSVVSVGGKFKLEGGAVAYPEMVNLFAKGMRKAVSFYLENAEITIDGKMDSLYNAKITGSVTHDQFKKFNESVEPINKKYSELYQAYRAANEAEDKEKVAEIEKSIEELDAQLTQASKDFVAANPASYVTPSVIRNLSYEMNPDELEAMIAGIDTTVAKTQIISDLKERLAVLKTVAIGQKAPDFTLNDVNDLPVALSSLVGKSKLLLIDFWASWCGPCRDENPKVVKVWKEFNKKGFDVFGVSLDRPGDKEKWMQAIKDDNLTWTHVSDLQYWDCAPAKLYAVNSIPANFLLDETGTIIARNLRGDDLYNKVKEVLSVK
jgi:peroxiredoxin